MAVEGWHDKIKKQQHTQIQIQIKGMKSHSQIQDSFLMTSCWQRWQWGQRQIKMASVYFAWLLLGCSRAARTMKVFVHKYCIVQMCGPGKQRSAYIGRYRYRYRDIKLKKKQKDERFEGGCGGGWRSGCRWVTGARLTCRQAPRCLLVSHCHLCQQTTSCIQPSALMDALVSHTLTANLSLGVCAPRGHQ